LYKQGYEEDRMSRVSAVALAALAEPNRQRMLRLVRDEPRSVGEIAAEFNITQQAVSHHLQVLKDAGLVAVRQDGQRRLYELRPEGLASVEQLLAEFWPQQLRQLKRAVETRDD
jgi:DNA-binding transcriptional ArsR family regulator